MTIPSSAFTINGNAAPCEVASAYSGVVYLALSSLSGVQSVAWSFAGNSASTLVNPTITTSGVKGETASFTMVADPGDGLGVAFCVCCTVTDSLGKTYSSWGIVGVYNETLHIPLALGEKTARHATYGWLVTLNRAACAPQVVAFGNGVLDFGSIAAQTSADLAIAGAGAGMASTDQVDVWVGAGTATSGILLTGRVSSGTQVTVTAHNYTAGAVDPASTTYYYRVLR